MTLPQLHTGIEASATFTSPRTGLWLVGARGSVATVATLGLLGMRSGLAERVGMVTHLPDFAAAWAPVARIDRRRRT